MSDFAIAAIAGLSAFALALFASNPTVNEPAVASMPQPSPILEKASAVAAATHEMSKTLGGW